MNAHTPGPWTCTADGYAEGRGAFHFLVSGPHFRPGKKADAVYDSRLIAAAPDLLAALENALRALEAHINAVAKQNGVNSADLCPCMVVEIAQARSAIAKAEGRTA